jgi:hypothetical protein
VNEPASLGRVVEYAWPAARWRRYLRAQLEGGFSRPFVASLDGGDHGYVELYRAAKDSVATRYEHHPYDLGLHVPVADLDYMQQGHVSYRLPHLLASMLNLDPRCRRVMLGVAYFWANTTCRTGGWRCMRWFVRPTTFPGSQRPSEMS